MRGYILLWSYVNCLKMIQRSHFKANDIYFRPHRHVYKYVFMYDYVYYVCVCVCVLACHYEYSYFIRASLVYLTWYYASARWRLRVALYHTLAIFDKYYNLALCHTLAIFDKYYNLALCHTLAIFDKCYNQLMRSVTLSTQEIISA